MPRARMRPRCFFDVEISGVTRGRIVFELFDDICPKTCDNFRALCTGEMGISKISGKPLHYKGAPFHRIVKNFMIQGGDFTSGDGTGGESLYGKTFPDENFDLNHDRDMLLSMANRGKDTNGSQFFITTQPAPHLDGVHVVFGQVIQGQSLVKHIENQKVDSNSRPYTDVTIINSGELVLQQKRKAKKRKPSVSLSEDTSSSESESSSDSDSESSDSESDSAERMKKLRRKEKRRKQKRKLEKKERKKKKKKMRKGESSSSESERDPRLKPKYHSTVRPDEIPEVPRPRFLYRGSPQQRVEERSPPRYGRGRTPERVPYNARAFMSKSGRRIKGRGTIRYRTPTRSSSRERSATPPHWRREQEKLRHLDRRARFEGDERWLKGDKLRGGNQKGNTVISRKLRAQMGDEYRREYDPEEIPRPGKPRAMEVDERMDPRLERKLRKKEKKLKKKRRKEKKEAKRRRKLGLESDAEVSSPERARYQKMTHQRRPGPVAMSPMHEDFQQEQQESDWDAEEDYERRRQEKSPSLSEGSPPRATGRTNGNRSRSRSRSLPTGKAEEDPYGGKKGMKSFQIKMRKEPHMLKDDGKRAMFQDGSSSDNSSRSKSRSPKRRSRFEKEDASPSSRLSRLAKLNQNLDTTAPEMVSVLPRGDSESPPPTHWKPGQKTWRPKREIIRKEIERRLKSKKDKENPGLPRTRSPSPEVEMKSRSESSDESPDEESNDVRKVVAKSPRLGPVGKKESAPASPIPVKLDRQKSPSGEVTKKKEPVRRWEPPEEPDEGEIIETDGATRQDTPPAPAFQTKMPPVPDVTPPAVDIRLPLKKSDTAGESSKPNPPAKGGISVAMVPRNIAMAKKSHTSNSAEKSPGQQKSPAHAPKPPSTPPKSPAQASRPPIPGQPPLPTTQPPKPPGLPVPPKLPPAPPKPVAEPERPSSAPATRLHGLPPTPLAERISALPLTRPSSKNMRTRTRSPSKSSSRSRSRSRHSRRRRSRSYSHSSRSSSRSASRSSRRRHSSSPRRRYRSYSHSTSRSRSRSRSESPRYRRSRDKRYRSTSTSRSRSPRRDSRSGSRSHSRSYSRSYSRSRSRSHSPRRRRYSSSSY